MIQAQAAEIEGKAAWAVKTNNLVKHGGLNVKESVHLGLEVRQQC
jgi:hypothetical protein